MKTRQAIEHYLEIVARAPLLARQCALTTPGALRGLCAVIWQTIGVDDVREVSRQTIANLSAENCCAATRGTPCVFTSARLRRFFAHLEKTDAILVNPSSGCRCPNAERRLPKTVLKPSEARAVLNAPDTQTPKGIRDKAMLELFYSTASARRNGRA